MTIDITTVHEKVRSLDACVRVVSLCEFPHMHSLGRADVTLRHARGKISENTVYACALLSGHADTHGTKGKN